MKKLTRRARTFKGQTLGLDVHDRMIQYALLDRRGDDQSGDRIAAEAAAIGQLLDQVCRQER